jgi:hypothetical protein
MVPSDLFIVAAPLASLFLSPASLVLLALFAGIVLWFVLWPGRKVTQIKPIRASTFHPDLIPANLDTIVIGSGSGGCACANLLAQAGQHVLLLEQHYRTGGCTHSFRENGCEWDTGLVR